MYHPEFTAAVRELYQLYFDVSKMWCLSYFNVKTLPPSVEPECHHNAFSSLEGIFRNYGINACKGGNLAGQKLRYILGSVRRQINPDSWDKKIRLCSCLSG
jgi:hypothetical protein